MATEAAPNTALAGEGTQQIPIKLTTRASRHAIPEAKYMVPSDWRRYQLSELINKVLGYDQPVPFDFIVSSQLLRTSLADFTSTLNISTESTLEIEYVESFRPPKSFASLPHDDWVSDLDLSRQGLYLSSSYDASVRIFSSSSADTPLLTLTGHDQSVLSACFLPSSSSDASGPSRVASGGVDRVVRVWSIPSLEESSSVLTAKTSHVLPLHSAPVSSVRPSASSSHLLTGSWDGTIGFWDLSPSSTDKILSSGDASTADVEAEAGADRPSKKRRRRAPVDLDGAIRKQPLSVLRGHSSTVARAIFPHSASSSAPTTAFSASHDHSVRGWDLTTGQEAWRKEGGQEKCLLDLDDCGKAGREDVLVTGGMDRTVCFWDARESAQHVSLTLHGHTGPVSSVSVSPASSSVLVLSGSYDGTLRLWDARSPKESLFTLGRPAVEGKGKKVMCVGWSSDGGMIGSGGEDGQVVLGRGNVANPAATGAANGDVQMKS